VHVRIGTKVGLHGGEIFAERVCKYAEVFSPESAAGT